MPAADKRYDMRWKEYYAALRHYKDVNGHCNVISKDPSNPKLSRWVENQRMFYRKKKLPPARIAMLEELGFEWERPHRSQTHLSKKETIAVPLELSTAYDRSSIHPDEQATAEDRDVSPRASSAKLLDGPLSLEALLTV